MGNEILLYGSIESETVTEFINQLNLLDSQDVTIRIASNGGNPEYGFGVIAKIQEHAQKAKVNIKVDGKAYSMGAFFLAYVDNAEALDVSEFLIHRAAYPVWYENDSDWFDDATKGNLERINKSLRAALEAKIDVAKFEEITDYTLDQIFSMDGRIDVYLNAKQAKSIGLISTITKITPAKSAEIASYMTKIAAKKTVEMNANLGVAEQTSINKPKNKVMTITEFKTQHPDLAAQLIEEGVQEERDRVGAWAAFMAVDSETVLAKIEAGAKMSQKDMAEMAAKSISQHKVSTIAAESAPIITPAAAPVAKTEDEARISEVEIEARKLLGLKN